MPSVSMLHVYIWLLTFLYMSHAFNLVPQWALVYTGPDNSNFGHSVALQRFATGDDVTTKMIVGAPKGNSSIIKHVFESGQAYECVVEVEDGVEPCKELVLDIDGNKYDLRYNQKLDGSYLGGAIDVLDDALGIMVCAPRWYQELKTSDDELDYFMQGICYWKNNTLVNMKAHKKVPLQALDKSYYDKISKKGTPKITDTVFYIYGEAGFSTHLVPGGKEVLMGAPGVLNGTGSVIRYQLTEESTGVSQRRKRETKSDYFSSVTIPDPIFTDNLGEFDYFGYAVDSGHFRPNTTYYVGGAPRGSDMNGSVLIFEYPDREEASLIVHVQLSGSQLGEYFGSTLCVVDVNNDGLDDLLVGAPLHSLRSVGGQQVRGDEGMVYVYINQGNEILLASLSDQIMGDAVAGARFGSAIAKLGDINRDGFNDFVVGAPYEDDGRGAIYIYNGRRDGVTSQYSQRIAARDIAHPVPITGFGISISRGLDVDGNHYNDIAVGAYTSRHVIVIRSSPIITLQASIGDSIRPIAINASEFTADACLSFSGEFTPPTVDVRMTISVDSRGKFDDGTSITSYTATLNRKQQHCEHVRVTLTQSSSQILTTPIEIVMHYDVDNSAAQRASSEARTGDRFCKSCPVMDPAQSSIVRRLVSYATGCGNADICNTDLSVTSSFVNVDDGVFILGSSSRLSINVTVKNSGEPAYQASLLVILPQAAPLLRLPPRCQEVVSGVQLECDVANPLNTDAEEVFALEVNMIGVTSIANLSFAFSVTSNGHEQRALDNEDVLSLTLLSVADIEIKGFSSQMSSTSNQSFVHSFEVTNHGPSAVSVVQLDFLFPVGLKTTDGVVNIVDIFPPVLTYEDMQRMRVACHPSGDQSFVTSTRLDTPQVADDLPVNLVKRAVVAAANVEHPHLPDNRTLHLNCSAGRRDVVCLHVICVAGPISSSTASIVISFKMRADLSKLDGVRRSKDIIAFTSSGRVSLNLTDTHQPRHHSPDVAMTTAVLYASLPEEQIAWIWLLLAVLGGVLIMLVLIAVLVKIGFFRRKTKEELEKMIDNETVQPIGDNAPREEE